MRSVAALGGWALAALVLVERYGGGAQSPTAAVATTTTLRAVPDAAAVAVAPDVLFDVERPARGPSRYEGRDWARGPSKVECFLHGARVDPRSHEPCHAGPPFWNWWLEFRNCVVSNACLHRGVLTLHGARRDGLPPKGERGEFPKLACNNWGRGGDCYGVRTTSAPAPKRGEPGVEWFDVGVHGTRILPGHFGHDVLNNYAYLFNTLWEANMTHRLGGANRITHVVDDLVASKIGDALASTRAYTPNQTPKIFANATWCFKTAFVGNAHTHSAELVFHKASPSRAKRRMWADYRDLLRRTFGDGRRTPRTPRRPLAAASKACPQDLKIIVAKRTHDPNSSAFLFANGRGRRVVNNRALVEALRVFGDVVSVDPGALPLADQLALAADADVFVSRMSSQVILSAFMPPGGLCVEIEAPDPSKLYYDHASSFSELAEIFGHAFRRSTARRDATPGVLPQAVIGDRARCRSVCEGPAEFRIYMGFPTIVQCQDRCDAFAARLAKIETAKDAYYKPEWYKNWWLADAAADVAAVVELVAQELGCDVDAGGERVNK